jgi:hypothetical protein
MQVLRLEKLIASPVLATLAAVQFASAQILLSASFATMFLHATHAQRSLHSPIFEHFPTQIHLEDLPQKTQIHDLVETVKEDH